MNDSELFEVYRVLKEREAKQHYFRKKNREIRKIREQVIREALGTRNPKRKEKEAYKRMPEYREAVKRKREENPVLSAGPEPIDYDSDKVREEFEKIKEPLRTKLDTGRKNALEQTSLRSLLKEADRRQKLDELRRMDLGSVLNTAAGEYVQSKKTEIEKYIEGEFWNDFRNAQQNGGSRRRSRGKRSVNFRDPAEVFGQLFIRNRLRTESIREFLTSEEAIARELASRMVGLSEELKSQLGEAAEDAEALADYVREETDFTKLERQVAGAFTKSRVLELMRHNERSRRFAVRMEHDVLREELLQTAVLKRIPDDYVDLYPAARQMHRKFILHLGPTNSGKTYQGIEALKRSENGIYLGPLRLLAFEQFESLNEAGYPCALLTGEEQQTVPGARYQSSTIEMLDLYTHYETAVIDEAQMIHDRERGGAWCQAILGIIANEIHLCASPDAEDILVRMIRDCGDEYEVVRHHRMTPLRVSPEPFNSLDDVRPHDALIVFSKKNVHAVASELQHRNVRCSIIYGSLPYDVRHEEARKFASGENEVLVATDAIGLGMNLPIERVVFLEVTKFDGKTVRELTPPEIKQIAGRAGRKGIFDVGWYTVIGDPEFAEKRIRSRDRKIRHAYIGFPEVLLSIDAPLSELMHQWDELTPKEGFHKEDLRQELALAEELEKICGDRNLIYRFCMMPFNAENEALHDRWKKHFINEMNGTFEAFDDRGIEICETIHDSDELRSMEEAYEICDLDFYYYRVFRHDSELPVIQATKNEISKAIIRFLSEQHLSPKRCRNCGRILPWNFPYNICDRCHGNERRRMQR